jgi:hypothetical protein
MLKAILVTKATLAALHLGLGLLPRCLSVGRFSDLSNQALHALL